LTNQLFMLPIFRGCTWVLDALERVLTWRAPAIIQRIRCYWKQFNVWWASIQLNVTFLGPIQHRNIHAENYMHKMQQDFYNWGTIQWTNVALYTITSLEWSCMHNRRTHQSSYCASGHPTIAVW
jgi:hypothetical protein